MGQLTPLARRARQALPLRLRGSVSSASSHQWDLGCASLSSVESISIDSAHAASTRTAIALSCAQPLSARWRLEAAFPAACRSSAAWPAREPRARHPTHRAASARPSASDADSSPVRFRTTRFWFSSERMRALFLPTDRAATAHAAFFCNAGMRAPSKSPSTRRTSDSLPTRRALSSDDNANQPVRVTTSRRTLRSCTSDSTGFFEVVKIKNTRSRHKALVCRESGFKETMRHAHSSSSRRQLSQYQSRWSSKCWPAQDQLATICSELLKHDTTTQALVQQQPVRAFAWLLDLQISRQACAQAHGQASPGLLC
mmetsp:Transcript_28732/g.57880  ORF Transcript_28732/g.57880 Transcript_28732/m.57880 type:complete len:313 (+) Transcript_28732:137-1075(+)